MINCIETNTTLVILVTMETSDYSNTAILYLVGNVGVQTDKKFQKPVLKNYSKVLSTEAFAAFYLDKYRHWPRVFFFLPYKDIVVFTHLRCCGVTM